MGSYNIIDEKCKDCGERVWVNLGDFEDITKQDYDGFICPYCGGETHFPEVDEMYEDMEDEEMNITKGHKTPNEAAGIV